MTSFAWWRHLTATTRMLWGTLLHSVFFSFVKNHSCVTQICMTEAAKCILVVVWRHHADVLLFRMNRLKWKDCHAKLSSSFCLPFTLNIFDTSSCDLEIVICNERGLVRTAVDEELLQSPSSLWSAHEMQIDGNVLNYGMLHNETINFICRF